MMSTENQDGFQKSFLGEAYAGKVQQLDTTSAPTAGPRWTEGMTMKVHIPAFEPLGTGLVTSEYGINVGGQCERNRYDVDDKTVFCGPDDFCSHGQRLEDTK